MICTIDSYDQDQINFGSFIHPVAHYIAEFKAKNAKSKKIKAKQKIAQERKEILMDLAHNPITQKSLFDGFEVIISKVTNDVEKWITLEQSLFFCEEYETKFMSELDNFDKTFSSKEFASINEFYAYCSAMVLVNSIHQLYDKVKSISLNKHSESFINFMEEQINESLTGDAIVVKPHELDTYFDNL